MDFLKTRLKIGGNNQKVSKSIIDFKNKQKDDFNECVICLEEMKTDEILSLIICSHIYHSECINLWASKKRLCPLCDHPF